MKEEAMKEDGGPAFPCVDGDHGMSLRQWYAGMALPGCQYLMKSGDDYFTSDTPEVIAGMAYKLADAMIAEGSKK